MGSLGSAVCHPRLGAMPPTRLHRSTDLHHRAVRGRRRKKQKKMMMSAASRWSLDPIGASAICQMACISISPWGRPLRPLAPWTATTPLTLPTLSLVVPPLSPALPSPKAGPSGSGMLSDMLSPCYNWVLRWFTRFAAPSDKGHAPRSWDSTVGLSH
jgi:hypothetical protein